MHPVAESLFTGYVSHFFSADHDIGWHDVEQEYSTWLDSETLLLGRIDAVGSTMPALDLGPDFFLELKTANPQKAKTWKQVWRMNPQSLTYGVLIEAAYPGLRRFCVRQAFKSNPPTFDFEWFSYSPEEIKFWREELRRIATQIRCLRYSNVKPWPTNFTNCFRYGPKYACPYFENGCSKLQWSALPTMPQQRVPHLETERNFLKSAASNQDVISKDVVILDATRTEAWLDCPEAYRKEYVEGIREVPGEALQIGLDFHALVATYNRKLKTERANMAQEMGK